MDKVKSDVVGGFNAFIESQKAVGNAEVTLIQFDNDYEVVYSDLDINSVPRLTNETFLPRGSTSLFDAVGRAVLHTDLSATDRNIIFVTITDGDDNTSREFKLDDCQKLLAARGSWNFMFLSSDIRAMGTAQKMGYNYTKSYRTGQFSQAMATVSQDISKHRKSNQPIIIKPGDKRRQ